MITRSPWGGLPVPEHAYKVIFAETMREAHVPSWEAVSQAGQIEHGGPGRQGDFREPLGNWRSGRDLNGGP